MSSPATGVLIMAYGSAPSMEDEAIFNYLRHILQYYRRTDPSEAEFDDLRERYRRTGESPLYRITEGITEGLQQALQQRKASAQFRTYMAMKHSPPFIEEVVEQMAEEYAARVEAFTSFRRSSRYCGIRSPIVGISLGLASGSLPVRFKSTRRARASSRAVTSVNTPYAPRVTMRCLPLTR